MVGRRIDTGFPVSGVSERLIGNTDRPLATPGRGKVMAAPLRAFRQIRSGEDVTHLAVRLGLLALLLYCSFILVRPFVPILAWSAVLAVALYPAFDWLSSHLGGRPKLAACVITVLCLAIIIGPVAWLGAGLMDSLMEI